MKQRCKDLRAVLRESPELCTPEELTNYWPGGKENRVAGIGGWIYCFAAYGAFMWRSQTSVPESEAKEQLARDAASDALRGAPIYVTLEALDKDGLETVRGVFPKSYHALSHCAQRDLLLAHLAEQIQRLQAINTPSAAAALGGALMECSYQQRVLCWIVCHDEPGLPFSDAEFRPDVDKHAPWANDLSPVDVVRIIQAHRTVNGARLQLVSYLLSPPDQKTGKRPGSWETLVSTAAKALGKDARTLARDTTLESLIAQVALAHEAERAA